MVLKPGQVVTITSKSNKYFGERVVVLGAKPKSYCLRVLGKKRPIVERFGYCTNPPKRDKLKVCSTIGEHIVLSVRQESVTEVKGKKANVNVANTQISSIALLQKHSKFRKEKIEEMYGDKMN